MAATLISGPPGAGKTTYALEHMSRGDVILDMDLLWAALSGRRINDKPRNLYPLVRFTWNTLINHLERRRDGASVWVVAGLPKPLERRQLAHRLGARVIVLAVEPMECRRRIREQGRSGVDQVSSWIASWWSEFEANDGETIVKG